MGHNSQMEFPRYLEARILNDLKKKMVLLVGPRQVGKTTLSRKILRSFGGEYLNYDYPADRRKFLSLQFNEDAPLVVLDEIQQMEESR